MHYEYLVFPEAQKLLESSGLAKRIQDLMCRNDRPYFGGIVFEPDFRRDLECLGKEGYFKALQTAIGREKALEFQSKFQAIYSNRDKYPWSIQRNEGFVVEGSELEDLELALGVGASFVLKPEEMWDFKRFGFSSVTDLTGCVGAVLRNHNRSSYRGHHWTTALADGRTLITEITGSDHMDLRILREDVTPYKTFDPFGNPVNYRPVTSQDHHYVSGTYSVEGPLLISVLRWITQSKIPCKILENNASGLLSDVSKIDGSFATCTEHLSPKSDSGWWVDFEFPIPEFGSGQPTTHSVFTESGGIYEIYVGKNNELIFSYLTDESVKNPKIDCFFLPGEVDDLIRGLFVQCAHNLGRTPIRQLVGVLDDYFMRKAV